jgi:Phage tail tube protein
MVFAINASETNRSKITYIAETQFGVTPATGLAKALRITQSNIVAKKGTKSSQEIRADRMVPGIIETDASSSGDVDGEFSAGTHDDFMEAFLLGTWSKAMNSFIVRGQSASIPTTSTVVLSGGDYTAFLVNGRFFKLEGFAALTNNGYFAIVSSAFAAGDTTVTVAGTPFTIETGKAAGHKRGHHDHAHQPDRRLGYQFCCCYDRRFAGWAAPPSLGSWQRNCHHSGPGH